MKRARNANLDRQDLLDVVTNVRKKGEGFDRKTNFDVVVSETLAQPSSHENKAAVRQLLQTLLLQFVEFLGIEFDIDYGRNL